MRSEDLCLDFFQKPIRFNMMEYWKLFLLFHPWNDFHFLIKKGVLLCLEYSQWRIFFTKSNLQNLNISD